jgi:hypothetical protein
LRVTTGASVSCFTLRNKLTQSACHDAHVPERPDSDREVLTSLPRSRPVRRSSKRGDRPAPDHATRPSAKPVAPRKPRAAKPPAKAAPTAAAAEEHPHPPPQRKIPAAGYAAPDARAGEPSASPAADLVSTSIQAAVELAQIGLALGQQSLKSMLDRLPKP